MQPAGAMAAAARWRLGESGPAAAWGPRATFGEHPLACRRGQESPLLVRATGGTPPLPGRTKQSAGAGVQPPTQQRQQPQERQALTPPAGASSRRAAPGRQDRARAHAPGHGARRRVKLGAAARTLRAAQTIAELDAALLALAPLLPALPLSMLLPLAGRATGAIEALQAAAAPAAALGAAEDMGAAATGLTLPDGFALAMVQQVRCRTGTWMMMVGMT
jgi:hypothetical protein